MGPSRKKKEKSEKSKLHTSWNLRLSCEQEVQTHPPQSVIKPESWVTQSADKALYAPTLPPPS